MNRIILLNKFKFNGFERLFWQLIVFHMFLLGYGCGNVDKGGQKMVFRYNEDVSVTTLDPAFVKSQSEIWIVSQLFNGLISLDSQLNTTASLAKNWTISENGKSYTFNLQTNAVFHNGPHFKSGKPRFVCAQDFVYSFYRILNPSTASPGSWIFNDKVNIPNFDSLEHLDSNAAFVALNDSQFRINLIKPFPPLLSLLSMPYCYAVPKEATEFYGQDFRLNPIGTGPFTFKLWEENVKLILLKNQDYFEDGLPYLDAVNIDFIQKKQLAFMNFIQGKYDFFNGLESSYKDELLTTTGDLREKYIKNIKLEKIPFLNTEYLGIIIDAEGNKSLNEKLVRQALNYSIDRSKMINNLRNGIGSPANGGFIPLGLPGNISGQGYHYDLDKARSLLEQANFNGTDIITINTTQDYLNICLFVKSEWEKIGVKSEVNVHPAGFLRQLRNKREIKVLRGSWIADYADAENYLSCFYSPNFSPNGPNYCHFKNDEFDELYRKAILCTDEEQKRSIYSQMDHILVEEAPILFLYYDYSIRLIQNNVKGLSNTPSNSLILKKVKIQN